MIIYLTIQLVPANTVGLLLSNLEPQIIQVKYIYIWREGERERES